MKKIEKGRELACLFTGGRGSARDKVQTPAPANKKTQFSLPVPCEGPSLWREGFRSSFEEAIFFARRWTYVLVGFVVFADPAILGGYPVGLFHVQCRAVARLDLWWGKGALGWSHLESAIEEKNLRNWTVFGVKNLHFQGLLWRKTWFDFDFDFNSFKNAQLLKSWFGSRGEFRATHSLNEVDQCSYFMILWFFRHTLYTILMSTFWLEALGGPLGGHGPPARCPPRYGPGSMRQCSYRLSRQNLRETMRPNSRGNIQARDAQWRAPRQIPYRRDSREPRRLDISELWGSWGPRLGAARIVSPPWWNPRGEKKD